MGLRARRVIATVDNRLYFAIFEFCAVIVRYTLERVNWTEICVPHLENRARADAPCVNPRANAPRRAAKPHDLRFVPGCRRVRGVIVAAGLHGARARDFLRCRASHGFVFL